MPAMSTDVLHRAQRRLGTVLNGKWHLDEVLGVGGMATVYAATHRNQKRVAIKMLHPELSLEEHVRVRFLREGYAANTVGHPGAVTIFDDNVTEDGVAFLVMELLEGETVHARLMREGTFPLEDALPIGEDVLDVLAAAHEKGIVHRDLKPENMFLTKSGVLRLLDFGIARLRELPMGTGVSANGLFMGTPAFMAPEHARGRWSEVDAQSDIWSVGATLFTLLTGKFVHESETAVDTLVLAVTQAPRPIRSVVERVPEPVAAVIDRALLYCKEDRWENAKTMQVALRSARLSLAPEELVLRGGQRDQFGPERSPSTPRGRVNATVRSGAPFSPRSGDLRRPPLVSDSLEPMDATRASSATLPGQRESTRGMWLALGVVVATIAAIALALYGRAGFGRGNASSTVDTPQVLVPSIGPVQPPGEAPAAPATSAASPVPAPETTAAAAVELALPAAPSSAAAREIRHDRRPFVAGAKSASPRSTLAPAPPSAETAKPAPVRENPFDRRF